MIQQGAEKSCKGFTISLDQCLCQRAGQAVLDRDGYRSVEPQSSKLVGEVDRQQRCHCSRGDRTAVQPLNDIYTLEK